MDVSKDLDFSRLLGFEQVAESLRDGVDFRDDAVGSKLGAKRGAEPAVMSAVDEDVAGVVSEA